MNLLRWFAAILVLAISPISLFAEETYEVRLHRPVKAGERFKLTAKVGLKMSIRTTINADELNEEKLVAGCKLAGEVKVVAATRKGTPKELRFKITEAECMEDGERATFFKAGDEIHITHAQPDAEVEVNGEEPTSTQDQIIDCFLFVRGDENATDDELVGTPNKVKTGETWGMNRDAVIADWTRNGFEGLKPEHLTGTTKLVKLQKVNDQPGMTLEGEFKIENSGMRVPHMPKEMQSKSFKLELKDQTEIPLDPTATDSRYTVEVNIETDSSGTLEEGGLAAKVRQQVNHRSKSEMNLTPIK